MNAFEQLSRVTSGLTLSGFLLEWVTCTYCRSTGIKSPLADRSSCITNPERALTPLCVDNRMVSRFVIVSEVCS